MSIVNIVNNKPTLIVLDVYETLLDMGEVERKVNQLLNSKSMAGILQVQ